MPLFFARVDGKVVAKFKLFENLPNDLMRGKRQGLLLSKSIVRAEALLRGLLKITR